ncbi:MAG: putative RND superfamily exporter protein, partial [Oceanicoccus sp.]
MKNQLIALYEILVLRKPLFSLLLTVAVVGWLATYIPQFKLDASADSLVLEGDEALKYYREVSKSYASEEFLFVAYRPNQDLLSEPVLAKLDQLRAELAALEGVSSVVSILDVPLLQSPKVSLQEVASGDGLRSLRTEGIDKELVRAELTSSPIYRELIVSADAKTTSLQVNLQRNETYIDLLSQRETLRELESSGQLSAAQEQQLLSVEKEFRQYSLAASDRQSALVDSVRAIIETYRGDAEVYLGGVPMIAADMVSFVKSDLVVFGSGIIAFIVVTLSIIFRRLSWVLLPLITCVMSASFMLGLITLLDWRMTVISSNFVALLLIITLSITIHLVVRYREMLLNH